MRSGSRPLSLVCAGPVRVLVGIFLACCGQSGMQSRSRDAGVEIASASGAGGTSLAGVTGAGDASLASEGGAAGTSLAGGAGGTSLVSEGGASSTSLVGGQGGGLGSGGTAGSSGSGSGGVTAQGGGATTGEAPDGGGTGAHSDASCDIAAFWEIVKSATCGGGASSCICYSTPDGGTALGVITLDGSGRIVDNSRVRGANKDAWLASLADRRWPCLAGQAVAFSCSAFE